MLLPILFAVSFLLFVFAFLTSRGRKLAHIPGPKFFFLDNYNYEDRTQKYGRVVKKFDGRSPIIELSDVELIHTMCHDQFECFMNRPTPLTGIFFGRQSTGLILAKDEFWKRMRRTISPSFNTVHLKVMIPMMEGATAILIDKLRKAAKNNEEVDMHDALHKLTLDIIGLTAFGSRFDTQRTDNSPLSIAASEALQLNLGVFQKLPILISFFIFKFFPPQSLVKRREALKKLNDISFSIIKQKRGDDQRNGGDFIDLLLQAEDSNTGEKLTDIEILDQCRTFLLAGQDTTGSLLSFVVYFLGQYPEIEDKVIQEISTHFSDRSSPINYEDLNKLEYLTMVINETLRMFPTAPVVVRESKQDTTLGDYFIPAKTVVRAPIEKIHRDPEFWGENSEQFVPERWKNANALNNKAYLPFGSGNRACIGMRFALMEAKIILIRVYQNFRFQLKPGQIPIETVNFITTKPKHGVKVAVLDRLDE
eukprot:TRINITY_DN2846_c0_g1_i1.p1 TRINITY_DN2846_c0_g1~~TRINITY_DN2846_c0_g1_i1.p1  ORF type:complete len:478 (-),score=77.96 TRINITY_DN2846_c0_g1_i1:135-1568(-)